MLHRLKIKNIALIKDLEIEFEKGLNILSGETGAGKSIIIDSINFLLGERADKTLIRLNEQRARVEGVFYENSNKELIKLMENYGIDFDGTVVISRSMSRENKSDIRVNGAIVTLSMLKQITNHLVDLCSQNENQFLLKTQNQLDMLDMYSGNKKLIEEYKAENKVYNELVKKLKTFGLTEEERNKEIDFLEFQVNEINEANLVEGEEDRIQESLRKIKNIEKIKNGVEISYDYFENQVGIITSLTNAVKEIHTISQYDEKLNNLAQRMESSKIELSDIDYELKEYLMNLDYNQEEFYILDSRMDTIKRLQKKYGKTIRDILEYSRILQARLEKLNNSKEEIEKLEDLKTKSLDKLYSIGKKISDKRKNSAIELEKSVIEELKNLNMIKTQFKISFSDLPQREEMESSIYLNGLDKVEFLFSANVGQPLLPLNKIISGGEMSRFMLAMKSVLADCDNIQTLIFDEIDTGISGKTSIEVAKRMAKISKNHQILVVTHSFQLVAMADNDVYVSKNQTNSETQTKVKILNEREIVENIAQMLGNEETIESANRQAIELRNWANKYKDGNM